MNYMKPVVLSILSLFFTITTFTGKVVGVSDGDTIEVLYNGKGQKVRLLDIDCPEKKQAFGQRAKQFTSDFCFGKDVRVETKGTDRYGRVLGTVYVNNQSLNEALVKAGLAWHFTKYSHSETFAKLEREARAKKVGLWSDSNPVSPWNFRKMRLKETSR